MIGLRNCGAILVMWCTLVGSAVGEEPDPPVVSDESLAAELEPIRARHQVPGLVAGLIRGDKVALAAAVGMRKFGSDVPITVNDKLHIGSCTKAMTATHLGMLIDRGQLKFESTIGDVFAASRDDLHPGYLAVTLEQLLTHRAGLPANGPWRELGEGAVVAQRDALLRKILAKPPLHAPGTKFLYSNVGYAIAGHMAELVVGKDWETQIQADLFAPLQMTSTGFGPPGTAGQIDQPWGHQPSLGKPFPQQVDNAPALGPAGTVHCTLADWGRFAAFHMDLAPVRPGLLKSDTLRRLHAPPTTAPPYACGWHVEDREWARGMTLTHDGSNTMWYASLWIAPRRNFAVMAVANMGGGPGTKACQDAIQALLRRVDPPEEK